MLAAAVAAAPIPTPIGNGPGYRLPAAPPAVERGAPIGRFRCAGTSARTEVAHVELFARGLVLLLPTGIGIGPRCSYGIRTTQPTGVVAFRPTLGPTLGDLFRVWGQPLSATRIAGFRAHAGDTVKAWVGGRRWRGDVRAIPLRRHAQIVVELGGYVPPHAFFLFPPRRSS